jgi:hypothetical protein
MDLEKMAGFVNQQVLQPRASAVDLFKSSAWEHAKNWVRTRFIK